MTHQNAIARLNHAGYRNLSHCTATLISSHAALTAKHCLKPDQHLLFGYDKGEWAQHRKAQNHFAHDVKDLAVICLDLKPDLQPVEFYTNYNTSPAKPVHILGYARSKSHIQTELECEILGTHRNGQIVVNCPLEPGMSGGPVFVVQDRTLKLVGVASATTHEIGLLEFVDDWVISAADKCAPTSN